MPLVCTKAFLLGSAQSHPTAMPPILVLEKIEKIEAELTSINAMFKKTNRTEATKRAASVRHRHGAGPGAHLRAVGDDAQDRQRERGQDTNTRGITKHIKQAAEQIGAITLNRFY